MRIGLALPHYDCSIAGANPLPWDLLVEYAQHAERSGFDSLWVSDHLTWDLAKYGADATTYGVYEVLTTLGALARSTTRVRLGTLVLCEALRPPAVLAKSLAAIDRLSGGRLDVGLGAGWYEPDYAAIGMAMPSPGDRIGRLAEATTIVRGLLHDGTVDFDGRWYQAHARDEPRPVQAKVPVFLGGKGDRLLGLVARGADGWNTCWAWTLEAYAERARALDAACERAGRDPSTVWRSLGLYALVGDSEADLEARFARLQQLTPAGVLAGMTLAEWRKGRLVGTPEQVRDQAAAFGELGVETIICGVGAVPFQTTTLDDVTAVAEALGAGTVGPMQ